MADHSAARKARLAILISGRGSNMQAIHQACEQGKVNGRLVQVVSNEADAQGLQYAHEKGITSAIVPHQDYQTRAEFEKALIAQLDPLQPDLVLLAGFMRRLTGAFTRHYASRLINIHPSILPRHRGLHTHASVLAGKERWHGCSVHFVSEELDGGPVFARSVVPVCSDDSESDLAARVLKKEHRLYVRATQLCVSGAIEWRHDHLLYHGKNLRYPLLV